MPSTQGHPPGSSRRGGRARSLTGAQITEAALHLVNTEGLESLSTRRLAEQLGVGQMTLYGYVRTKDEIIDGVGDFVLSVLTADVRTEGSWPDRLTSAFRNVYATFRRHPAGIDILLAPQSRGGPKLEQVWDVLLGDLRAAGFTDAQAITAITTLTSYVIGFAWAEVARVRRQAMYGSPSTPPELVPNLATATAAWAGRTSEQTFEQGLEVIINGLRECLEPRQVPAPKALDTR
jgi:AcrR family transcriptional regulator